MDFNEPFSVIPPANFNACDNEISSRSGKVPGLLTSPSTLYVNEFL